jgi:hypothetical protein
MAELMDGLRDTFVCPVCGYPGLDSPAYSPRTGNGSYEICYCCRFEYGVTDLDRGFTHEQWRCQWIADGMPWRGRARIAPHGWDPREQLRRIGF